MIRPWWLSWNWRAKRMEREALLWVARHHERAAARVFAIMELHAKGYLRKAAARDMLLGRDQ